MGQLGPKCQYKRRLNEAAVAVIMRTRRFHKGEKRMHKGIKISLIITACVLLVGGALFGSGILVLDYSVKDNGVENGIEWKNTNYVQCSGRYSEGKTLAKTSDGRTRLDVVKEDPSHTFVVMRSFLDNFLYVRKDYVIPQSGKITAVYWNSKTITDTGLCQSVQEIHANNTGDTFSFETDAIFALTKSQRMKELWVSYENCPVCTNSIGYMGTVNGKWAITVNIPDDTRNEDGSWKTYTVTCREIPDKYIPELKKYFT